MTILIDDREKAPFQFPPEVPTIRARLETGDYSLCTLEHLVAIERKKCSELFHTVGAGRAPFRAELDRLRAIMTRGGYAAIVVEGSLPQIVGLGEVFRGRGRLVKSAQVIGTLAAWSIEYMIPIWFSGELELAERITWNLLWQSARRLKRPKE